MAAACMRYEDFEPLLPDLILGEEKRWWHLVGGTFFDAVPREFPPWPNTDHHISFYAFKRGKDGQGLLVAIVRLFCKLYSKQQIGTPPYIVVVGKVGMPRSE
jgi:hypothetical protein